MISPRGAQQNTILRQIIVTFVIKTADLTVKTIRPDIILKNTNYGTVRTKRNSNMLKFIYS